MNSEPARDWWRQAVVYEIYPRSFADGNGDGLGDLKGVQSRIPYLVSLGVDAVWMTPFYPSPLADGGYDVADYRNVDPRLGTLDDFSELAKALHAVGIQLIVDIVPNHSSNQHEWFQQALAAGPGSAERDRYIFRDGLGHGGNEPPSDWVSHFGGSAWTRVTDDSGELEQWYLHLFAPEQPDWNWDNENVREDFKTTLRFWADLGANGFRVDVAQALVKDMTEPLRSKPTVSDELTQVDGRDPLFDRDEVHDIFTGWRAVFNEYEPPLMGVAEAWVPAARRAAYARPSELGQAFNFDLLKADWNVDQFRDVIATNLVEASSLSGSSTWVLSNHDVVRHASRYGLPSRQDYGAWLQTNGTSPKEDREIGLRQARAATLLILALPGSTYLYQGEELGLFEVADIPAKDLQDPIWVRSGNARKGRDGCRVPLPWTRDGASLGFSSTSPHLPQPKWFSELAVEMQESNPSSTLSFYREALRTRRTLIGGESLEWAGREDDEVLHFVRPGGWHCVTNFGTTSVELPEGDVLLSSGPLADGRLPQDTTAWLLAD